MKEIPLSKGYVAKVDDEDYERLSAFSWHILIQPNGIVYAHSRLCWFADGKKCQRHIWMHREVLRHNGPVDHIDGDTMNNQKHNLRACTRAENSRNRKQVAKNNTTGYKGVSVRVGYKLRPYKARIRHNGKTIGIGNYSTPEEAANAYNSVAPIYFGEFARLNVVPNKAES